MLTASIGGTTVGRLGYGCFALSGGYGEMEPGQAIHMLHAVLDSGVNLLDTADVYAAGENETLVGGAIADRRNQVVISTKFGWVLDSSGKPTKLDSSPSHVRKACEASLRRLGTDHIDLYIQHRVDPAIPIEATVGELVHLRDAGKIRSIGLSEAAVATLVRAHGVGPIAAMQSEYSLWSREPETLLLPECDRLGVAFIAYSPLGRGFLSGAIRSTEELPAGDFRRTQPRFNQENLKDNLIHVDKLAKIARGRECTPSQLALAWLLAQPWNVIPIPSTRRLEHFRDNLKALDLKLTPSEVAAVAAAIPPQAVRGARHPADHMKTIEG
jgi:aryl-alcohol dehydrogenase-like predicted oxidoreductase